MTARERKKYKGLGQETKILPNAFPVSIHLTQPAT